jgi:transmembrane sensor
MQDNSKFDELLISYLSNELNQEDEAFVIEWINFNDGNRRYFEEFKSLWRLLEVKNNVDDVDVNREWNEFQHAISNRQQKPYALKTIESNDPEIVEEEIPRTRSVLYKSIITTAVAASLLIIVGFISGFFNSDKRCSPGISQATKQKSESPSVFIRYEKNTSGKLKQILLGDGTEITLSSNSELSYQEPFAPNRREITLTGKAYFKVAEDKARPFTVFSGDLSTTVLGTKFTVTAFRKAQTIVVRLFEGKVVVKPVSQNRKKPGKDFYLSPGEELIYNTLSSTAKLRKFVAKQKKTVRPDSLTDIAKDVPLIPLNEKGSWFMFNNQSLDLVLDQLANLYDVKIVYSKADVKRKYFIGKFEKSESVENVLNQIAALNNLKVQKKADKFILSK